VPLGEQPGQELGFREVALRHTLCTGFVSFAGAEDAVDRDRNRQAPARKARFPVGPGLELVGAVEPADVHLAMVLRDGIEGEAGDGLDCEGERAREVPFEEGTRVGLPLHPGLEPEAGDRSAEAADQVVTTAGRELAEMRGDSFRLARQDPHRVVGLGAAEPAPLAGPDGALDLLNMLDELSAFLVHGAV
jgi:hypothetical protein